MDQAVSTQLEQFIILALKISPFVFSILLRVTKANFSERWFDTWNQYKGGVDETGDWTQQDSVFHCVSLYENDRSTVISSLVISLVFVTITTSGVYSG